MVYVWGSRLYGKVDNVKGLFHVATKFGHFDYFPLFPMGSWVITEKTGSGWRGVPIPISIKSVLFGWLRAAALFALVIGSFMVLVGLNDAQRSTPTPARVLSSGRVIPARSGSGAMTDVVVSSAIVAISLFILIGSRWVPGLGKATPRRAEQLGRLLGLREDVLDALRRNQYNLPPSSGFEVLPARGVQDVATANE
jgi:hypothetical protein